MPYRKLVHKHFFSVAFINNLNFSFAGGNNFTPSCLINKHQKCLELQP